MSNEITASSQRLPDDEEKLFESVTTLMQRGTIVHDDMKFSAFLGSRVAQRCIDRSLQPVFQPVEAVKHGHWNDIVALVAFLMKIISRSLSKQERISLEPYLELIGEIEIDRLPAHEDMSSLSGRCSALAVDFEECENEKLAVIADIMAGLFHDIRFASDAKFYLDGMRESWQESIELLLRMFDLSRCHSEVEKAIANPVLVRLVKTYSDSVT